MGKPICQGCKGSGTKEFNRDGYCVCPKGVEKKAEEDLRRDQHVEILKKRNKRKSDPHQ